MAMEQKLTVMGVISTQLEHCNELYVYLPMEEMNFYLEKSWF